ncbi:MAG: ORF6N domain-containing protein [Melioribacteraceae bacterium]|nr:MAG: ORF6N domain-containing protein [Melioribacteraceae bacterium]
MHLENIQKLIIEIRNEKVILDSDIAALYNVETRDINKAVKNNPEKFPDGYVLELTKDELEILRWKFSTAKFSKTRVMPKAFTEKGLYMLATILRSKSAAKTTIAIVETFAKIRELTRNLKVLSAETDQNVKNSLIKKSGEIFSEILEDKPQSKMKVTDSETSIEVNFAIVKLKHTIKMKKN